MKAGNAVSSNIMPNNMVPGVSHRDQDVTDNPGRNAASQPVRDIEDIIAKLEVVTRRLAFPLRTIVTDEELQHAEAPALPD